MEAHDSGIFGFVLSSRFGFFSHGFPFPHRPAYCFIFTFWFWFNSQACGFFKGKSMTKKIEAWEDEAQEGPGRGSTDPLLCRPLRREGRVTAGVESKAGWWGKWAVVGSPSRAGGVGLGSSCLA